MQEKFKEKEESKALKAEYPPQLGTPPKLNSSDYVSDDLLRKMLTKPVKDKTVKNTDKETISYINSNTNTGDFGFGFDESSSSMSGGTHRRKIRTIKNIQRKFNRN